MTDDSYDEANIGTTEVAAKKRIAKLKKERDERINAVVAESNASLEALRNRVTDYQEDRRRKRAEADAESLMALIIAVERKMEIEDEMRKLVTAMHEKTQAVEEMMKAGYSRREQGLQQVMEGKET